MSNIIYISAGLPVAKNTGQSPSVGVNTDYISAGLPPEILTGTTTTHKNLISLVSHSGKTLIIQK